VTLHDPPPSEPADDRNAGGPPSAGRVGLTPWPVPVALLVIGGCLGWTTATLLDSSSRSVPTATWWMVLTWLLVVAVLGFGARITRERVRTRRIEPLLAVRLMVLGKSAALVGPACGGFAIGLGIWRVSVTWARLEQSGTLAMLALGVVLVGVGISGMAMEWACRVPGGDQKGRDDGESGRDRGHAPGRVDRRGNDPARAQHGASAAGSPRESVS
jgi:Protein of unknown function (DUF3180)